MALLAGAALAPIQRAFERLQSDKQRMLVRLAAWSPERLRFRSGDQSWSALDVLDHLVRVEEAVVASARKNSRRRHPVPWSDRLRSRMVVALMRSPLRVKVPQTVGHVIPRNAEELEMVSRRWLATREEMLEVISALRPEQARFGLLNHPVGGWMDTRTALQFLSAHIRHHGYQLDRISKSLSEGDRESAH